MADNHIIPMANIKEECFQMASYQVLYYEGYQLPINLEDHGESGDIFAFRGIGGLEVDRRLFVKSYTTKQSSSR
jgi:hypothetical protein